MAVKFLNFDAVQIDGLQTLLNEAAELLAEQSKSSAEATKVMSRTDHPSERLCMSIHFFDCPHTIHLFALGLLQCTQVQKENSKLTKTNKELDLLLMDSLRKLDGEAVAKTGLGADASHRLPSCTIACLS